MKALILTLLLSYSCTDYSPLKSDPAGLRLEQVKMDISHLNEIEWWVGAKRNEHISQSLTFIVDLPKVTEEDLHIIHKERDVDSWIIRVIAERPNQTQDIGSFYVPFKRQIKGRVTGGGSTPVSATLKIYYAAAYASERFRNMNCPAFGHNKKIKKMKIESSDSTFDIFTNKSMAYGEKSQQVELSASSFNGGNSLIGNYYLEIAPYNSEKKIIRADFKRIPSYISVIQEDAIKVKSCDGAHRETDMLFK